MELNKVLTKKVISIATINNTGNRPYTSANRFILIISSNPYNHLIKWPQDWKRPVFIPIPKKGNAKECSNYCTIVLISHASKAMLKILQARLQPSNLGGNYRSYILTVSYLELPFMPESLE